MVDISEIAFRSQLVEEGWTSRPKHLETYLEDAISDGMRTPRGHLWL